MFQKPTLPRAHQDAILLSLYPIAQRVVAEWIAPQERDDAVHDFVLQVVRALRFGSWRTPLIPLEQFALIAILEGKWRRKRTRRSDAARAGKYLTMLEQVPREWMSQELHYEEHRLRSFADNVRGTLPERGVQIHRMVRDDGMTYNEVAKKLGISRRSVHRAIHKAQDRFRHELPSLGIEHKASSHGGRPACSRSRRLSSRAERGICFSTPRKQSPSAQDSSGRARVILHDAQ